MRILYLTPYVPSQVRVRPYQLIRHLAESGHEVTLICLAGTGEEPEALEALRGWCREVVAVPASRGRAAIQAIRAVPSAQPFQAAYGASKELVAAALQRAERHDIVHIEHLRGSSYGPPLRDYPLMLDAVDCISLLFERAFRQGASAAGRARALLDLARTRRAEARLGDTFEQIVVTSAEDRWALQQLQQTGTNKSTIAVIPNGVDLAAFPAGSITRRDRATVILAGKMSYHANEAAALYLGREIMPLIWRERRDVRCLIVGRSPPAAVQALAADPRVIVTGSVPAMTPFLHQATIAVVPLRYGVGIQNKVLEAMATATPVVASPQAARALDAQAHSALRLAATPATFASSVLELLDDPAQRAALSAAGRRYVETYHDWRRSAEHLIDRYVEAGAPRAEREIQC
jgi:glycosyltransferase involved in cell wall biosynthesis